LYYLLVCEVAQCASLDDWECSGDLGLEGLANVLVVDGLLLLCNVFLKKKKIDKRNHLFST